MQADLRRGEGASGLRGAGRLVAILAGAPLIAMLTLCAPDQTLAACGGAGRPAGVHAAASGGGSVHAATGIAAPSGGGSGGGSLGCANGSSASGLRGLPVAASGRVVEGGAHRAHTASRVRTAPTRTGNASAHLHGVRPGHRA
jgi:hypothetical protein